MKRLPRAARLLAALACCIALLPALAAAQDGTVRQRLKEWREQRQQQAGRATPAGDPVPLTQPGDHEFTMHHDGLQRKYRVHVPASYDPGRAVPLLFALHGGGGSMDYQADDARYGLITHSEREGFVVVFPNGYSKRRSGRFATWNAGHCCGAARDENVDDVGFIRRVFTRLTQQMNIDRQRVYATGMSNGALMSYRLACEMPEVFTAIAAVAGTDNTRTCHPASPVSVLHIHAADDAHVLFEGGAGPDARDASVVTDFTSVPATIAKWVASNACPSTPRRVLDKQGAHCDLYAPCRGGTAVQLCVTDTGGHSWPGGTKRRSAPPSQAISANDVMWEFFNRR